MNHLPGVLMMFATMALVSTGWLARTGRLPRNHLVGIRTRRTLADPVSWDVAHRTAGPWIIAAGVADLPIAIVLLAGPPAPVAAGICGLGALLIATLTIIGASHGVAALGRPRTGR